MPKKRSNNTLKSHSPYSSLRSTEDPRTTDHNPNVMMDIASFELSGYHCKLVALQAEQSELVTIGSGKSPRQYCYVNDEIVHFCLDGKWFALCKEDCIEPQHDRSKPQSHPDRKLLHNLTERELQIVQLVCHGLLTKQIAAQLYISEFTVNTYIKTIFNKLGVRSRAAMVYKFTELSK